MTSMTNNLMESNEDYVPPVKLKKTTNEVWIRLIILDRLEIEFFLRLIIMIYIVLNAMTKVMWSVVILALVYIIPNVSDWQHYLMEIGHVLNVKYVFRNISSDAW